MEVVGDHEYKAEASNLYPLFLSLTFSHFTAIKCEEQQLKLLYIMLLLPLLAASRPILKG